MIMPRGLLHNPHRLADSTLHYETIRAEQFILRSLLYVLDLKSDQRYRELVDQLHRHENSLAAQSAKPVSSYKSVLCSAPTEATTAPVEKPEAQPITKDPYYNATKQQWAHQLLTGIQSVVNQIVTGLTPSTGSGSGHTGPDGALSGRIAASVDPKNVTLPVAPDSTPTPAPTDLQIFQAIQTEINRLVNAGTQLSNPDFDVLYGLPSTIFTAVQRATAIPGGKKTEYINELAKQYGNEETLVQVFADGRVEGLQDILNVVLSKLSEEDSSIFADLITELDELRTQTENFDEAGLARIKQAGETLTNLINESALSKNDKVAFVQKIVALYEDQVAAVQSFRIVMEATVFVNQHQEAVFAQISNLVASLMGTFAPIDLGAVASEISSASISAALQAARAINSRFTDLTEAQQNLVNTAMRQLETFNADKYLGAVWAYFVASTVLANKPTATMQEVGAAITAESKEMTGSTFALASSMESAMKKIVETSGKFYPAQVARIAETAAEEERALALEAPVDGASENRVVKTEEFYTIYSQISQAAKLVPAPDTSAIAAYNATTRMGAVATVAINYILLNFGDTGFLPNISQAAKAQAEPTARAYFQFRSQSQVEFQKLGNAVEQAQNESNQFSSFKDSLYSEQLFAQAGETRVLPLPSAVASVLIDRYMPKEVDFLTKIYQQLYYSNIGSSVGNAMIEAISKYVNAATYFNFGSYVGQQPAVGAGALPSDGQGDMFPGNADSARAKLNTEREQAALYLQYTQNAEKVLEEQLAKITADSKLTNEQRTQIIDNLNNYRDNLNSISGALVLLQNYLAPLGVTNGDVAGTFKVTGGSAQWQARLEILEDALVSGLSGSAISGGMFPLQAMVQSDQQSYADMGQNYQLELQMHLTSMQQEWTVVSTSLQVLNQIYLSLARSLMG
ncbi:hypothetical protein H359_0080 [Chlamydia ibidis 10-1398/6]|nr:hypothetical protein H359_0080 [Chlamydia ibidis 10-1398/6]